MTHYKYEDHLLTRRLITRFLTAEDVREWTLFFKDRDATAFFPNLAFDTDEEKARWWIERQLTRYRESRFGLQALIHKETKEFIGQCGLLTQEVDGVEEVELGFDIFKKYWGQGYAPEAAQAFLQYAFQNNLAPSVVSIIDVRNTKARRVAWKCGMAQEKETQWAGINVVVYRIGEEKWKRDRAGLSLLQ
jgi:RimJ/RimL family protein N-acetyltransferase